MNPTTPTFENFEDFWPHFLSSHLDPRTRWTHVAALAAGALGGALALRSRSIVPAIVGAGAAFGLAVGAHPVFEGNTPENFGRPLWAARAVARLCFRTVTGAVHADLEALKRAS